MTFDECDSQRERWMAKALERGRNVELLTSQRNALLEACQHYITCSHQSYCKRCMEMAVSAVTLCEPMNQGVTCPTCGRVCADQDALAEHQERKECRTIRGKGCPPEPGDEFVRPSDERHL